MIINRDESSIEFDNVLHAQTNINDTESTIKVLSYSFVNKNSKGGFKAIDSVEDLEALHTAGQASAKRTFAMMNND